MVNEKRLKDELYEEHLYGQQRVLEKLRPIKKYRNKTVLIAGCGAGATLFDLYFYGAEITAIDQSRSAVEFIRDQFEELDCDPPELIGSDLADVELPRAKFDYVLCYGVLHHTLYPQSILASFREALKPGGELELLLYHKNSFVRLERRFIEVLQKYLNVGALFSEGFKRNTEWWDKYENPVWETYTRDRARELVEDAGFEVDELRLENTPFGQFTTWILPYAIRLPLRRLLKDYRWHIRIDASK